MHILPVSTGSESYGSIYVSFSSSINHENGADITVALDYQSLIRELGEMAGGEEKEKRVLGVEDGVISLSINE